jgi:hypothetical protein
VDTVHKLWTSTGHGPWWIDHHGWPSSSLELGLAATPGHSDFPQGGENDEELAGVRFWSSPKTERRCGGGAARGWTVAPGNSSTACYDQVGEEWGEDPGVARSEDCSGLLYIGRGAGEGRPVRAINGQWNAASMCRVKAPVIGKEKWGDAD